MLSTSTHLVITEFQNCLKQLHSTLSSAPLNQPKLKQTFEQLKITFQTQIMRINASDFAPPVESKIQSYLTETHKQIRLLEMDLKFLQASHQSTTFNTRLTQIQNRLDLLLSYGEAMLGVPETGEKDDPQLP
ncbi:MAG: heterocyst frequency control protein PatD [Planktothrix sp.]|uniref:heterocyst frequency control protein PatD n=1 Tax=Planktothrix sp. TaxID=3088171 RepID=UPI0038D4CA6D